MFVKCALCGDVKHGEQNQRNGKSGPGKKQKETFFLPDCKYQTGDLKNCCPLPNYDEAKNDPDCKHHLAGINKNKEGNEKVKAYSCLYECYFKNQGLLKGNGEIDKEKFKEMAYQRMLDSKKGDFEDISMKSVDYCVKECKKNLVEM
jgi:hypothetical protein